MVATAIDLHIVAKIHGHDPVMRQKLHVAYENPKTALGDVSVANRFSGCFFPI
ncbi:MAG: hypothetical protein M3P18_26830 [Actinomycetota bacterium]|nr:hypothetical protein [Actinomycetota bacterium]